MRFGLKKKPGFPTKMTGRGLDPYHLIEPVLWVDGLTSGRFQNPREKQVFVSFDPNPDTLLALSEMYPEWTFYGDGIEGEWHKNRIHDASMLSDRQKVHHIYVGNRLSFIEEGSRQKLLAFINDHLAPGGYVVVGYEDAAGWSAYKVVVDVLRELMLTFHSPIDGDLLDRLFFELHKLAEQKIPAFRDKVYLDKLLMYLKQMPSDHCELVLRSDQFYTFYPGDIHRLLSDACGQALRFVGALPISRNYLHLGLSEGQKKFVGSPEMSVLAVQRHDLILMPFHRVDIWQRPSLHSAELGSLSDFYLGCVSDFDHFPKEVNAGHLKLNYSDAIYSRLREICSKGFYTISEIVEQAKYFVRSPQETANRLMLLVMGGQLAYSRNPPKLAHSVSVKPIGKLRFLRAENAERFSSVEVFVHTTGNIVFPGHGIVIPFDQKTSAVIAALTKVHESFVAEYCAEVWQRFDPGLNREDTVREFRSVLGFFKRHYLGKFLAMGLVDRVLVNQQCNGNRDLWNRE